MKDKVEPMFTIDVTGGVVIIIAIVVVVCVTLAVLGWLTLKEQRELIEVIRDDRRTKQDRIDELTTKRDALRAYKRSAQRGVDALQRLFAQVTDAVQGKDSGMVVVDPQRAFLGGEDRGSDGFLFNENALFFNRSLNDLRTTINWKACVRGDYTTPVERTYYVFAIDMRGRVALIRLSRGSVRPEIVQVFEGVKGRELLYLHVEQGLPFEFGSVAQLVVSALGKPQGEARHVFMNGEPYALNVIHMHGEGVQVVWSPLSS